MVVHLQLRYLCCGGSCGFVLVRRRRSVASVSFSLSLFRGWWRRLQIVSYCDKLKNDSIEFIYKLIYHTLIERLRAEDLILDQWDRRTTTGTTFGPTCMRGGIWVRIGDKLIR